MEDIKLEQSMEQECDELTKVIFEELIKKEIEGL